MEPFLEFLNRPLVTFTDQIITVGQLLIVPIVVTIGFLLVRWLGRVIAARLATKGVNADVIQLISRAFYVIGIAVLAITTLDLLNVPLTAFAFISGAVAIGVGFGAQNIINNFISGWILMWERPIRIDDFVEIGDTSGTIERINTRSTRIRRVDGVHLLVPNSYLLENIVVNWTLVDSLARSIVRVGVAYGSPVEKVAALIEQAVREQEEVLEDPEPTVIFEDFGDSSLIFDTYYWIHATGDRSLRGIRSKVRFRVAELFKENDIVIAFPQRDVHIDGSLRLENADGSKPTFDSK
ncbi:MAG: small-conductance mechanosensitive channel [Limisphaerales bacterium]